jgi:hypothetical protein
MRESDLLGGSAMVSVKIRVMVYTSFLIVR